MGFFRRDKEPKVSISYKNGPKVALVMTPDGPVPLQQIVDRAWVNIAAVAWWGYGHYDRGLVVFDPQTGDMKYVWTEHLVEFFRGNPILREILESVENYNPDTQVVLLTPIVF